MYMYSTYICIVYAVPLVPLYSNCISSTGAEVYMLAQALMDLSTVLLRKLRSYLGMLLLQLYTHSLAGLCLQRETDHM